MELLLQFFSQTRDSVLELLNTDKKRGLSSDRAAELKEQYGPNKLKEKKKKTNTQRFFEQFKDAMILILIAAAIISF